MPLIKIVIWLLITNHIMYAQCISMCLNYSLDVLLFNFRRLQSPSILNALNALYVHPHPLVGLNKNLITLSLQRK